MPDDEMREIIQDFIVETKETIEDLDRKFLELEKSPDDPELLNSIFRAMHTIKGASGFLGFTKLVEVAHRGESILNKLRQFELRLDDRITVALLKGVDMIKLMVGHIEEDDGIEADTADVMKALDAILEGRDGAKEEAASAPPAPTATMISEEEAKRLLAEMEAPYVPETAAPAMTEEQAMALMAEMDAPVEAPEPEPEELKKLGEILVESGHITPDNLAHGLAIQAQQTQKLEKAGKLAVEQTIRVDTKRLDGVLDLVGELVLGRNRLSKLVYKLEDLNPDDEVVAALAETSSFLDLITTDIQVAVMKTRMQPIKKVFNKFPRMVWDLAHSKGKDIDFVVTGEETELDKSVIEEIGDPLVHLLRNSVDHGVEPPEERVAAGKPARGSMKLSAGYEGNHVIITLEDDGRGIDRAAVKSKAVANGSIGAHEAERLSDKEVLDLIFLPGLSTAKVVSDVSGRGVGMDVVKNNITKLKGNVILSSTHGKGTKVEIRLPLTVAILKALMVVVAGDTYALPLASVAEIIRISSKEIKTLNGKEVVSMRDHALTLIRLDREFGRCGDNVDALHYVVVLSIGGDRVGLLVDSLLGQEDVVIKQMGDTKSDAKGIAGATITGDGNVVLILDIEVLVKGMIKDFEGAASGF